MFQKKLMSQFRENLQTHGWTDPILEDPSSQGQVSNKSSNIFTTATIPGKIDNNFLTLYKAQPFPGKSFLTFYFGVYTAFKI